MGVFLSTWMLHVPAWGVVKTLHAAPFFLRAALECRRTCYLCNCITFSTLVMVLTLSARYIRKMFLVLGKWSKLVLIILCTTIASRPGPFNSKTKFHHVPQIQVFVPQHPLKHVRNAMCQHGNLSNVVSSSDVSLNSGWHWSCFHLSMISYHELRTT